MVENNTEQLLKQLTLNLTNLGTEIKSELQEIKSNVGDIKKDIVDLKVATGKLEEKMNGIDTRLKNEETISRDDYGHKFVEYEAMGIAEYWIVDYRALGAIPYIGKPKQTYSYYLPINRRGISDGKVC